MKILEQLDSQVDALLQKLSQVKKENESLRMQVQSLRSSLTALEAKNHSLTDSLAEAENMRSQALERLDRLMLKIQDFDHVE
ncbi:MAG: cell division protein ZapB [Desulfovibrio sp.]|nr:cell division protein ZapB [Desulfovibrio sp.]